MSSESLSGPVGLAAGLGGSGVRDSAARGAGGMDGGGAWLRKSGRTGGGGAAANDWGGSLRRMRGPGALSGVGVGGGGTGAAAVGASAVGATPACSRSRASWARRSASSEGPSKARTASEESASPKSDANSSPEIFSSSGPGAHGRAGVAGPPVGTSGGAGFAAGVSGSALIRSSMLRSSSGGAVTIRKCYPVRRTRTTVPRSPRFQRVSMETSFATRGYARTEWRCPKSSANNERKTSNSPRLTAGDFDRLTTRHTILKLGS